MAAVPKLASKPRPTILISDDNPYVIKALERLIGAEGGRIIADLNSKVVELARTHHPELIILDIIQKTDGRHWLGRLKAEVSTRDIVVFVLTGSDDPVLRKVCLRSGATTFFVNPPTRASFSSWGNICPCASRSERNSKS